MLFTQLELTLLAFALVVDSVLLLILFERVNRPNSAIWLYSLVIGTWMAHASGFCHALIRNSHAETFEWLDRCNLITLAFSSMVLPCAMVHAAARLNHTRYDMLPPWDWRYGLAYLPLGLFLWNLRYLTSCGGRVFSECVESLLAPYVFWVLGMNLLSITLFLRFRSSSEYETTRLFLARLSLLIVGISLLLSIYVGWARESQFESLVLFLLMLSPLSLASLFLYHILRDRLLPMVIERSLVYGASLIAILFAHQIFIVPLAESMQRESNLDVIMIEGILLLSLVLAWTPLRQRFLESLRYLLSREIFRVREAVGALSLELSQQDLRTTEDLCRWFTRSVAERLELQQAWIWFIDREIIQECQPAIPEASLEDLNRLLSKQGKKRIDREDVVEKGLSILLESQGIHHIFLCQFKSLRGLIFLGPRKRNDRFNEEQFVALSILFDQFVATIFNRLLERERIQAERLASQQEKLAVLGLLSGSLAHEIRNPLSSIRTIARLMREDLEGQDHARDVDMILEEIDRLTQATSRLLDYSKIPDDKTIGVSVEPTLRRLLHILQPWAQQQQVTLVQRLELKELRVKATDATLSEVLFNLLRNAIEAARSRKDALVEIRSERSGSFIQFIVSDNGPGIDPSIRDSIYLPFVTSKEYGTGLGLYVAAERVRSIGGTIECSSDPSVGTTFTVRLPILLPE